jgi:hypothetical protein
MNREPRYTRETRWLRVIRPEEEAVEIGNS